MWKTSLDRLRPWLRPSLFPRRSAPCLPLALLCLAPVFPDRSSIRPLDVRLVLLRLSPCLRRDPYSFEVLLLRVSYLIAMGLIRRHPASAYARTIEMSIN